MSDFYALEEAIASGMVYSLVEIGISGLFSLAAYILTALSLYTIARRRGLHGPWLAWIPVARSWLLGSISDQFQYVTQGKNKAKRKWLLGLSIASAVLWVAIVGLGISVFTSAVINAINSYDEQALIGSIMGSAISMVALLVPLLAVSLAGKILGYVAKYDVFKSLDPANCVLYLVLSILFPVTEPFFLVFNRNKDLGMPPRRPVLDPPAPAWNPPEE